jgi:predicted nuclease of predicted toxin-antitoxin system
MRFLVDECAGPAVADWLRSQGYDVFSIYDSARGLDDEAVIEKALLENWILVTNDKDFGEKVYRERRPHHGVVLMRLDDERSKSKIKVLKRLLENHAKRLPEQFVVVTEKKVRFAGQ